MKGFFAADYASARSNFLSACITPKWHLRKYKNDCFEPEYPVELITDTARLGPKAATKMLVLISGTHGVEGFCGSACQVAASKLGLFENLPPDVAVLMIHAINPYGFSYSRRVTEANVDLNRNCVPVFGTSDLEDFNRDYDSLNDLLNPIEWRTEKPHVGFEKLLDYIKQSGMTKFQQAVSIGQYRHAGGLFYGGSERTWSRVTLEKIISTELRSAHKLLVVDYHTGLGPPGFGELISTETPTSRDYERTLHIYGGDVKSTKPTGSRTKSPTKSSSANVHGSIDALFKKKGHKSPLTYVALEFGTVEVLDVLEALRADNWFYQHGSASPHLAKDVADEMRKAFYPDSEEWRQAVLHRSAQVLTKALAALSVMKA